MNQYIFLLSESDLEISYKTFKAMDIESALAELDYTPMAAQGIFEGCIMENCTEEEHGAWEEGSGNEVVLESVTKKVKKAQKDLLHAFYNLDGNTPDYSNYSNYMGHMWRRIIIVEVTPSGEVTIYPRKDKPVT